MTSTYSAANAPERATQDAAMAARQYEHLMFALSRRVERAAHDHGDRLQKFWTDAADVQRRFAAAQKDGRLSDDVRAYATDMQQRLALTLEVLSERAEQDIEHEKAGTPPVLIYDHEVALDGRTLPRPTNKVLLKILPPDGIEVKDWKRPYMIVDPRAGHGAGIGGFKTDSQVGVALRDGHPVYFVVFRPHPEPGQTLADVMRAEAAFVAEIRAPPPRRAEADRRRQLPGRLGEPASSPPPIPTSRAARGQRRAGRLLVRPARRKSHALQRRPARRRAAGALCSPISATASSTAPISSRISRCSIPGATFSASTTISSPRRSAPGELPRVREMVGRLPFHERGRRSTGSSRTCSSATGSRAARRTSSTAARSISRRSARRSSCSPSWGDNITPPQQALNWIVDTYADEHEIKIRGQRIIYMVHDKVGHLGIFVSSSVAKKEHAEVTSTMKTIEALSPGLYEMTIDRQDRRGRRRALPRQLPRTQDGRHPRHRRERPLGRARFRGGRALLRSSERISTKSGARPLVQAWVTPEVADLLRKMHPGRVSRALFGDVNPLTKNVRERAAQAAAERKPADPNNPFLHLEKLWADGVVNTLDAMRDFRDAVYEMTFLGVYGSPTMLQARREIRLRAHAQGSEDAALPARSAVGAAQCRPRRVRGGGDPHADPDGGIPLQPSGATGSSARPRCSATTSPSPRSGPRSARASSTSRRSSSSSSRKLAFKTLPDLLPEREDRKRAVEVVEYIAGSIEEMEPATIQLLQRFHSSLGLPGMALPAPRQDPLKQSETAARDEFGEAMATVATVAKDSDALEAVRPKGKARPR